MLDATKSRIHSTWEHPVDTVYSDMLHKRFPIIMIIFYKQIDKILSFKLKKWEKNKIGHRTN